MIAKTTSTRFSQESLVGLGKFITAQRRAEASYDAAFHALLVVLPTRVSGLDSSYWDQARTIKATRPYFGS